MGFPLGNMLGWCFRSFVSTARVQSMKRSCEWDQDMLSYFQLDWLCCRIYSLHSTLMSDCVLPLSCYRTGVRPVSQLASSHPSSSAFWNYQRASSPLTFSVLLWRLRQDVMTHACGTMTASSPVHLGLQANGNSCKAWPIHRHPIVLIHAFQITVQEMTAVPWRHQIAATHAFQITVQKMSVVPAIHQIAVTHAFQIIVPEKTRWWKRSIRYNSLWPSFF